MAKWILKIGAKKQFRLADCLQEAFTHDGIIALANRQCMPECGDGVYLFQTEQNRGLCGVATVLAKSAIRDQPPWQQRYGIANYAPDQKRILLRVDDLQRASSDLEA